MGNFETQRGFTLAELSISVVIMGILVAGALAGRSWVDNAKVTSTVAQVQSYTNAVGQFRRLYVSTPGDLYRAGLRLPGCPGTDGAACNPLEGPLTAGYNYYVQGVNPTATVGDGK